MSYKFELVKGSKNQINILYELLEKRAHKISHFVMPSFKVHQKFIKYHPYRKWFLIKFDKEYVGSLYIKDDNSIGLNLQKNENYLVKSCLKFIKKNFKPKPSIPSMVPEYFFVNVSASNNELIKILKKRSLKQIQISFKI